MIKVASDLRICGVAPSFSSRPKYAGTVITTSVTTSYTIDTRTQRNYVIDPKGDSTIVGMC
jgi:hypothetical protein